MSKTRKLYGELVEERDEPTTTSVTHIEMETAQNETKQTEAAPDDSSASASEEEDRQNYGSTSAFFDLRSNPNHVGTSKFAHSDSKRENALFSSHVVWTFELVVLFTRI